ncbi:hypothetical protein ACJ5H2_16135 [Nocardioides sp. R1-1]|uniref:hypothetical protein n=1 Tax=Nocardioides sp. R1-1 TaxID=3383502 RepID=UPI0038D1D60A
MNARRLRIVESEELVAYVVVRLEACLAELGREGRLRHPAIPLLKARLAVADA